MARFIDVHDKSPVESVEEFFFWMHQKAINEQTIVLGRIGDVIYEIWSESKSLDRAFELFQSTVTKGNSDL